jgi:hypothetical protein
MSGNAPRTIPAIAPTEAQWAVIDGISDPYVKADENGVLSVYEVKDDNHVAFYTIETDGEYIVETLLEGFHYGWTTLDSEGYRVEPDDDTGELVRVSDEPESDWAA